MKLVHHISEGIRIEEIAGYEGRHRADRIYFFKDGEAKEMPVPGLPHKLSLYHNDKFICSTSFACYEEDAEKYRAEYIERLIKHFNEVVQA